MVSEKKKIEIKGKDSVAEQRGGGSEGAGGVERGRKVDRGGGSRNGGREVGWRVSVITGSCSFQI